MTFRRAALPFAVIALIGLTSPALAADLLPFAGPPLAAAPASPPLSADDRALVAKAVDYLQRLKAAQGDFTQIDPKGRVTSGVFSMLRPGRARFQYAPPAALLVVADGSNVSVYDRKLKTFDQYPLDQTPLKLLLGKTVRLDQGVVVTRVDRSRDGFAITARDARRPALGGITLRFSQAPMALKGWTVMDAQNQKTAVVLKNLTPKAGLPADLFVLRDPAGQTGSPDRDNFATYK